jgi:hypothetical protein
MKSRTASLSEIIRVAVGTFSLPAITQSVTARISIQIVKGREWYGHPIAEQGHCQESGGANQ